MGRGHLDKAEVIIQTFQPEHEVLKFATGDNYLGAADYLLKKRRLASFPPFSFIAKLEITLKTESLVLKKVRMTAEKLAKDKRILVSPPMPAFHERTIKGYTWQIILRAKSRKVLLQVCSELDPNFKITLDPPGLL